MSLKVEMNRMLEQMKAMEQAATLDRAQSTNLAAPGLQKPDETQEAGSFSSLFKQAVDQVNDLHQTTGELRSGYLNGDPNIDITRVMVASQKSSIATDAMIKVRNEVVESYKKIMNMPL